MCGDVFCVSTNFSTQVTTASLLHLGTADSTNFILHTPADVFVQKV